jgi:hypothetical protein
VRGAWTGTIGCGSGGGGVIGRAGAVWIGGVCAGVSCDRGRSIDCDCDPVRGFWGRGVDWKPKTMSETTTEERL